VGGAGAAEIMTACVWNSGDVASPQAQDRFLAGAGDNVEVVTAQDALAHAYDDQIAALYRANQSRADLERALGHIGKAYAK